MSHKIGIDQSGAGKTLRMKHEEVSGKPAAMIYSLCFSWLLHPKRVSVRYAGSPKYSELIAQSAINQVLLERRDWHDDAVIFPVNNAGSDHFTNELLWFHVL